MNRLIAAAVVAEQPIEAFITRYYSIDKNLPFVRPEMNTPASEAQNSTRIGFNEFVTRCIKRIMPQLRIYDPGQVYTPTAEKIKLTGSSSAEVDSIFFFDDIFEPATPRPGKLSYSQI